MLILDVSYCDFRLLIGERTAKPLCGSPSELRQRGCSDHTLRFSLCVHPIRLETVSHAVNQACKVAPGRRTGTG